jgi:hypothetical protein
MWPLYLFALMMFMYSGNRSLMTLFYIVSAIATFFIWSFALYVVTKGFFSLMIYQLPIYFISYYVVTIKLSSNLLRRGGNCDTKNTTYSDDGNNNQL